MDLKEFLGKTPVLHLLIVCDNANQSCPRIWPGAFTKTFMPFDDPAAVIRNHSQHIAHVHLEDIGKNRVHQHLTPGKGVIDFEQIFDALESIPYGGRVTVELYPYETTAAGVAKRAWDYLKPML